MKTQETPYFTLHTVTDGVYAAVIKQGTGALGNAAIVDLGDQTLVFDTLLTPTAAHALRQVAEEVTGRSVSYVLNSHRHSDHIFGNMVFREVPIIASATTRAGIADRSAGFLATVREHHVELLQELEAEVAKATDPRLKHDLRGLLTDRRVLVDDLPTFELVLPSLTFVEQMSFYGSKRTAHFIDYGANHTQSDSVLYLPDEGILLAGDIVATRFHASMGEGDHRNWVDTMTKLEALNLRYVIPGHGDVSDGSEVTRMKEYLHTIIAQAEDAIVRGVTPETAEQESTPDPYVDYGWFSGYQENLAALIGMMSAVS